MKVVVLRRAVEIVGAPKVIDGVLQVTVRTRAAGHAAAERRQPLADDQGRRRA